MKTKPRSAVLIQRDDKLLLIKRDKTGKPTYYVLPGGGIEAGETPAQAGIREMREELGVDIRVVSAVKNDKSLERETWIVKATIGGDVQPIWLEEHKQTPDNHYEVVWLPVSELGYVRIIPEGARYLC
jgi:8-oxo-dGTP pyrophosphatase MutT (NUDIX family)